MPKAILCAVDFQAPSLSALRHAAILAHAHGISLHVVHVASSPIVPIGETALWSSELESALMRQSEVSLRHHLTDLHDAGLVAESHVIASLSPADAILKEARNLDCDLIVIGSASREGVKRLLLGSVAERIVHTAAVDVLIIPAGAATSPVKLFKEVLCAVDFSAASENAFAASLAFARTGRGRLHVAHVWEPAALSDPFSELSFAHERRLLRDLKDMIRRHPSAEVPVLPHVARGVPHREIVAMAIELSADLIVLGAGNESGLEHFFLGSVAERVLRSSPVPVLAVRNVGLSASEARAAL